MVHLGECFFDHFERTFPDRLTGRRCYPLESFGRELQVLYYDRCFEDCRVFVTLGMTHAQLSPPSELMIVADGEWDAIPGVLASCALSIMTAGTSGWGHLVRDVPTSDPGFSSRIGKDHLYVTVPHALPEPEFFRVPCGEGVEGHVFQGVFVSSAEAQYLFAHGAKEFEDRICEEEVDLFSLLRPEMRLQR